MATAEEVTIRGMSAFADGTTFTKNFERFVDKVNETGKGVVQIDYIGGGGKVMSPFEVGNAIQGGTVDIANVASAFYTTLLPEGDAIKLSEYTISEERENGAWAFMNQLHNEKMNAQHIARQKDCVPFHLYLGKNADPIGKPDLTGYKIRVTPIYRAFFAAMGAELLRTAPGEVYTALESGTVDGYGWPTQGVLDLGWHEVTGYRVDPPFYRASVEVIMNLEKWNSLNDEQKAVIMDAALWMESLCEEDMAVNDTELARQADVGIETITFSGDAGAQYLQMAKDEGWKAFIEANPENGPKLQELLTR
ncbi:MAG: ABC transporter substrate-binding protein [Alphaproteobacteria bacterium]|nr:ABC transporter substrate-binding protein [Alphaproteobacteria bacterium]